MQSSAPRNTLRTLRLRRRTAPRASARAHLSLGAVLGALASVVFVLQATACGECIEAPVDFDSEVCMDAPEGVEPTFATVNGGVEFLEDGGMVLTWSQLGLECGVRAGEVSQPDGCRTDGWALTVELSAARVATLELGGVLELEDDPEIIGSLTVLSRDLDSPPTFTSPARLQGGLELVGVQEGCVTGVLHDAWGESTTDSVGGPLLDGSFMVQSC